MTGGNQPISYAWTLPPGQDARVTIRGPANQNTVQVGANFNRNTSGTYSVQVQCRVTDAKGGSIDVTAQARATWESV